MGYLPSSLYTFTAHSQRLARDYPIVAEVGFPEFDRMYYRIASVEALCCLSYSEYNTGMKTTDCIVCHNALTGKQTLFCSIACKNKKHQGYPTQKDRGLARKLRIITTLGGKCSLCGYNKNLAAFAFHHTDPSWKQFKLDMRSLSNRTWEAVLVELEKCVLVCANCHAELHNPDLNLDKLL
jgi:hypothetical protein